MIVKTEQLEFASGIDDSLSAQRDMHSVLHLINGEHFAGAERVQDLLATALPEFGYQADFACLKPGKFTEIRHSKTPVYELKMRNSFDLLVTNEIVRIARNENYTLLHAHTPRTLMIGAIAAKRLGLPLVYHVHSPVGRDSTRAFRNRVNTWVESLCLKSVDAMICVSGSLSNYMREIGHDENKITIVRNGVPACFDLPNRNPPTDHWTLGTMALFRPRKGIESLLQAMAILKKQDVNVHLRAVGGFEAREYEIDIMQMVSQLGIKDMITWTGFQANIKAQFQQMDLFVLPSLFGEGLPMVVLESMAYGVPVIASNVEGIPEAVRDNVDGLIFEAGSAEDLAGKIVDCYGDGARWQEFSLNAIQRQREELSDKSMAAGVAEVYDEIRQPD